MKTLKKIISVILVFVTLFCSFSVFALADGEGYTYTGDSFWGWLLGENTPDWLDDIVGFVSTDYCEDSPTHLHTANSFLRKTNFLEQVGSFGTYDYECQCQYCGDTFFVNEKNVAKVFKDSYGGKPTTGGSSGGTFGGRTGYVKEVEEKLGTTQISSNGYILPVPVKGWITLNGYGWTSDKIYSRESTTFGIDNSIVFLSGIPLIGLWLDTDSLPLSPYDAGYTFVAEYSTANLEIGLYSNFGVHPDIPLPYEELTSPVAVAKGQQIPFSKFFQKKVVGVIILLACAKLTKMNFHFLPADSIS